MANQWNEIDRGKPTTRRKTCPSATLSTTNLTWTDPGSNPGLVVSHLWVWRLVLRYVMQRNSENWKIREDGSSASVRKLYIYCTTWRYIPEINFLRSIGSSVRAEGLRKVFELGASGIDFRSPEQSTVGVGSWSDESSGFYFKCARFDSSLSHQISVKYKE
jgi:hypothetical protein